MTIFVNHDKYTFPCDLETRSHFCGRRTRNKFCSSPRRMFIFLVIDYTILQVREGSAVK